MIKSRIQFVAEYNHKYAGKCYDVVYRTKVVTYFPKELPKTVIQFIETAKVHKEQPTYEYKLGEDRRYHLIINGTEIIHKNEE